MVVEAKTGQADAEACLSSAGLHAKPMKLKATNQQVWHVQPTKSGPRLIKGHARQADCKSFSV